MAGAAPRRPAPARSSRSAPSSRRAPTWGPPPNDAHAPSRAERERPEPGGPRHFPVVARHPVGVEERLALGGLVHRGGEPGADRLRPCRHAVPVVGDVEAVAAPAQVLRPRSQRPAIGGFVHRASRACAWRASPSSRTGTVSGASSGPTSSRSGHVPGRPCSHAVHGGAGSSDGTSSSAGASRTSRRSSSAERWGWPSSWSPPGTSTSAVAADPSPNAGRSLLRGRDDETDAHEPV